VSPRSFEAFVAELAVAFFGFAAWLVAVVFFGFAARLVAVVLLFFAAWPAAVAFLGFASWLAPLTAYLGLPSAASVERMSRRGGGDGGALALSAEGVAPVAAPASTAGFGRRRLIGGGGWTTGCASNSENVTSW